MKLLRELGFGRPAMGEVIAEGCRLLLSKIAESQGEPIDLFDLILASASSNIGVFVLGYRYLLGHPEHQHLCKALRDEFMTSRAGSVLSSLPSFVAAFSQYFPSSRTATLIAAMRSIDEFASTHLSHHVATLGDNEDRDFIDAYLRKSKGHEHEAGSTYSLSSLAGNVVSFLLAGAVTASGSLMRELLLVAANQDTVQARIQSEIDTVVGSERHPAWGDRVSTPYTMAFIWEAHRRYTMMPLGVPRRACQDVVIGEHFIPEDATVVANLWAVHNNPAIWKDPDKFDPTRLLNSDGSISGDKLQRVIPFSVGRRMCPGEIFASVEIYIYLTSILQKFRVLPVKGHVVDVNVKDSEIMQLGRHKLRCIPRINTAP
ncbi:cytochrome P450 2J1 [Dermacentor silvarum]|uniref:cytochrome P450 2J1 n=1 Tax=Dermacentor silvarum TaxID=543639 RepID=UPI00189B1B7D|nr:cytochrome P450 2J1 [Dermacentor silvarum]